MRSPKARPNARRGLTLVELLVTVALMLLVMSVIVAIFTAATEGMTIARTDQQLASVTRRIDSIIIRDLNGATARFTPPLNPVDGLGYFEYGENSLSDEQSEDSDDYLAFTSKAPPGQPFTGRIMVQRGVWLAGPRAGQPRYAPVTVTSDHAEIIYFLRGTNLYRRVLLVLPDQKLFKELLDPANPNSGYRYRAAPYNSDGFDLDGDDVPDVSWQGANDISVHFSPSPSAATQTPIPNTLGDLTNRHNRAFRPGFTNDYFGPDGVFDDREPYDDDGDGMIDRYGNGVPDIYPTLYPNLFSAGMSIVNNPGYVVTPLNSNYDTLAFPFVFPGAFSDPSPFTAPGAVNQGPIMNPGPPQIRNHSPLDLGDNVPIPNLPAQAWTWWGFPTWAETRSISWNAASKRLNQDEFGRRFGAQSKGLSWADGFGGNHEWLPGQNHWYSDIPQPPPANYRSFIPPAASWQDDLIATNVRSFDVKALDPNTFLYSYLYGQLLGIAPDPANVTPRYVDLGYAADIPPSIRNSNVTEVGEVVTFGHEGRIPPLTTDSRFDYQTENSSAYPFPLPIGDDGVNRPVIRLSRVWDSWSTDYSNAPISSINPFEAGPLADTSLGYSRRPLYPSYPPPYPSPLYGIQIRIRLAAPDGSRAKDLTIRQDFSGKL